MLDLNLKLYVSGQVVVKLKNWVLEGPFLTNKSRNQKKDLTKDTFYALYLYFLKLCRTLCTWAYNQEENYRNESKSIPLALTNRCLLNILFINKTEINVRAKLGYR